LKKYYGKISGQPPNNEKFDILEKNEGGLPFKGVMQLMLVQPQMWTILISEFREHSLKVSWKSVDNYYGIY